MKTLVRTLLLLTIAAAPLAFAAPAPYTQAAFDQLQKTGKPTLVEIHADWCPTCRAQAPVVDNLLKQKEYQGYAALRVDFDAQKDIVKAFGVSRQSTLLVFKGGKELGRSTGDTSSKGIAELLQKAQ